MHAGKHFRRSSALPRRAPALQSAATASPGDARMAPHGPHRSARLRYYIKDDRAAMPADPAHPGRLHTVASHSPPAAAARAALGPPSHGVLRRLWHLLRIELAIDDPAAIHGDAEAANPRAPATGRLAASRLIGRQVVMARVIRQAGCLEQVVHQLEQADRSAGI